VACADHPAIADHRSGFVGERVTQQGRQRGVDLERLQVTMQQRLWRAAISLQALQQPPDRPQRRQRIVQGGQFARARGGQRNACCQALEVHASRQIGPQRLARRLQQLDHLLATRSLAPLAHWLQQPLAQQPAAGGGDAAVHSREQRGRGLATQGLDDLQVAPGHRIDHHPLFAVMYPRRLQVGGCTALRARDIGQQRARRAHRLRHALRVRARQRRQAQGLGEPKLRAVLIELPGRAGCDRYARSRLADRFKGCVLPRPCPRQTLGLRKA